MRAARISSSCIFNSKTSSSRSAGTRAALFFFAFVLGADLRALQLEQVFGAAQRIFQRAIGVVEQRRVGQAPLLFVLHGAGKAVGMQLAAEAMKLVLQRGQIEIELRLQAEDGKIIAARRRLNLAAMRAKKRGVVVADGARPTGNGNRGIENFEHSFTLTKLNVHYENDEPQPQERVEFGLMKLNPWRISVSS